MGTNIFSIHKKLVLAKVPFFEETPLKNIKHIST
jgi:hypothetical protein